MPRHDVPQQFATASTIVVALMISWLTLTPVTGPEIIGEGSDKLYHLIAFAALTFPSAVFHPRISGFILIFAILFGAAIEIIQPSVGRSGSWGDFLADVAGALIGMSAGRLLGRRRVRPSTAGRG